MLSRRRAEFRAPVVNPEVFEHCLERAGSMQAPIEAAVYAQRLAPLAAATELDLARACRSSWFAAAGWAARAGVQGVGDQLRTAFRRGMSDVDATIAGTVTPIITAATIAQPAISVVDDEQQRPRE